MFWKRKNKDKSEGTRILLGMIILKDENSFSLDNLMSDFSSNYGNILLETTGDSNSVAFKIGNDTIAIAHMPFPIPSGDIESTAEYAYNWETAVDEIRNHKSHIIVSILGKDNDQIRRFKIFTQTISSILRITNSIGVYKGNQSLLIPKEDYLGEASYMSDEHLPLNLWIYFGLRCVGENNSGYTYGLKEFNKTEIEIVNSSKSIEEIRELLYNISHYVLDNDIIFKHGETCGISEEERIYITLSKGKFVSGESFKLTY